MDSQTGNLRDQSNPSQTASAPLMTKSAMRSVSSVLQTESVPNLEATLCVGVRSAVARPLDDLSFLRGATQCGGPFCENWGNGNRRGAL